MTEWLNNNRGGEGNLIQNSPEASTHRQTHGLESACGLSRLLSLREAGAPWAGLIATSNLLLSLKKHLWQVGSCRVGSLQPSLSPTPCRPPTSLPGLCPCRAFSLEGSLRPPYGTLLGTQSSSIILQPWDFPLRWCWLQLLPFPQTSSHMVWSPVQWTEELLQEDGATKKSQWWAVARGDRQLLTRWHFDVRPEGLGVRKLK